MFSQVQALYVIHEFGHRAVTHSVPVDSFVQHIYMNVLLGFSTTLLQVYHNLHHTFPHKTGAVLQNEEKGKETVRDLPLWKVIFNMCSECSIVCSANRHKKL